MDNSTIMGFGYKGYLIEVGFDTDPQNPRLWGQSIWYGLDSDAPFDLLKNKDGKIDLANCEELKGKWWSLVSKTEHSGVSYYLGEPQDKWDSSCIGVIAVSKDWGDEIEAAAMFKTEIDEYEHYANGDLYEYTVKNDQGEILDKDGGFLESETAIKFAKDSVEYLAMDTEEYAAKYWAEHSD